MIIQTEVVSFATRACDLFQAYENALESLGPDNVFLLESLQGPEPDCRLSILGLNRLAEINLSKDFLRVDKSGPIQAFLLASVRIALGHEPATGDSITLRGAEEFWTALRVLLKAFPAEDDGFRFGYLASIRYEIGHVIESIRGRSPDDGSPLISLGLFQAFVCVTAAGETTICARHGDGIAALELELIRRLLTPRQPAPQEPRPAAAVHFAMVREEFTAAAAQALEYIRSGDIYQVQLGHEVQVRSAMRPPALYRRLRDENPSPYMFLCRAAGLDLIGASPESYVRLEDGVISMRPIAGTLGKSPDKTREEHIALLTESAKENAEHIMLVDLCRNDIGRVCADRSLEVPDFMVAGEFSNLFHLISTVTARMREGCDAVDLIRATFPAGTMVGAPKVRAMEIIEELEFSRRGYYAGGIGLLGFGDFANLALCIRMASRDDDQYLLRASAGVVVDSDPMGEWNETLIKMNRIYRALTGQEMTA